MAELLTVLATEARLASDFEGVFCTSLKVFSFQVVFFSCVSPVSSLASSSSAITMSFSFSASGSSAMVALRRVRRVRLAGRSKVIADSVDQKNCQLSLPL